MRKAMVCGDGENDLRYRILTSKLRLYVWYTILGYSVKEIADKMHMTVATVSMMRKKAFKILGVRHSSQQIHEGTLYGFGMK